ncbi:MAG: hypothetical protein QM784_22950 [Polyangiaceae bacterium]
MSLTRILLQIGLASLVTIGCGASQHKQGASEDSGPLEIPAAQRPNVERSRQLGQEIFEQDSISARATDALRSKVKTLDPRTRGWLTLKNGEQWTVPFLIRDGNALDVLYRVKFKNFLDGSPEVEISDPPTPADDGIGKMFAARETAMQQQFQACSDRYNTVVLPATALGKEGWLVYLLAATTEPNVVVSGGHHRFLVSPDGTKILDHFQFTKACLNLPFPKVERGERVGAMMITHLTSDTPTEMHVFLSLLHQTPLYVGVVEPRAVWAVDGSRVRLIATKE